MPAASYQKDRGLLMDTTLTVDSFANTNHFGDMSSGTVAETKYNLEIENTSFYQDKSYTKNYDNVIKFEKMALKNELSMDGSNGENFKAAARSDKVVYENSNYGNGQLAYKALERESGWRVVELDSTPVSAISGYEQYPVFTSFRENDFACTSTVSKCGKMNTELYQQNLEKTGNVILASDMVRSFGDLGSISSLRKYFEGARSNEKLHSDAKNPSNFGLNQNEATVCVERSNDSFWPRSIDRLNDSEIKYKTKMSFSNNQTSYMNDQTEGIRKSINSTSKPNKSVRLATIETLGDKIRKLREDMKELRSTTVNFHEYMGRMFSQLSAINQISWKAQWTTEDSSTLQTSQSAKTVANKGSIDLKPENNDKIDSKYGKKIVSSPNIVDNSTEDYTEKNRLEVEHKVQNTDNLRLIPILNHRHKALHTSECSIDSGYQDSTWHSPRQSRELASQVVTPASPINEYPVQVEISTTKQKVDESYVKCQQTYIEPLKYNESDPIAASINVFEESLVKEQFHVAKPRLRSDSYHSIISTDSSKLERPIPKQRTKFILIEQECEVSIPEATNKQIDEPVFYKKNTEEAVTGEVCDKSELFLTQINQPICSNQQIKQIIDPISVQKRNKPGDSSVDLTLIEDSMRKKEPISTKNKSNVFKNKQRLREKFSDVIKRSAAKNNDQNAEENELESSQFRRRSMRMMTEFQIFDMKEAVVNLNHAFSVANKCDTLSTQNINSGEKQRKAITPDRDSLQNGKEVVHTYENVELIRQEPKQFERTKQTDPLMTKKEINQASHDDIHAKNIERTQYRPSTPQKYQQGVERSLSTTESQSSIFTEIEQEKQMPSVPHSHHNKPMLLRPKAELAVGLGDFKYINMSTVQHNDLSGVKLSPSERSAFTPVLSSSMKCLHQKNPYTIAERYDVPYSEIEPVKHEYKQTSLPLSAVRNKRNFIKELAESISTNPIPIPVVNTIAPEHPNYRETKSYNERGRLSIEESVISTEHSVVTSFKMSSDKLKSESVCSSNPHLAYSAGIDHRHNKTKEPSQNVYVETGYQNIKKSLENISAPTDLSRRQREQKPNHNKTNKNIQRTNHQNTQPSRQCDEPVIQPFAKYGAFLQDPLLSVRGRKSKGQILSFRSNIPLQEQRHHHQQEVRQSHNELRHRVASDTNSKDKDRNPPMLERSIHATHNRNESASDSKKSSRKSTVALIRASFISRKDKSVLNQKPDDRNDCASKSKPRSSSLTSKKNVSTTPQVAKNKKHSTSSMGAATKKETKPKSIPHFGKKSKQDEAASSKKVAKESKGKSRVGKDPEPILPSESSPRRHGNADSEIMDRFLRSEPPPNSNVRSHLQKLRSSFRTPRNKAKILAESRYKDDMAMGNTGSKSMFGIRPDKNAKLRQDAFTYV